MLFEVWVRFSSTVVIFGERNIRIFLKTNYSHCKQIGNEKLNEKTHGYIPLSKQNVALTGSSGLLFAQVITVEIRMNIFCLSILIKSAFISVAINIGNLICCLTFLHLHAAYFHIGWVMVILIASGFVSDYKVSVLVYVWVQHVCMCMYVAMCMHMCNGVSVPIHNCMYINACMYAFFFFHVM